MKQTETKGKLVEPSPALKSIWVLHVEEFLHPESYRQLGLRNGLEVLEKGQFGHYSSKTKAIENAKVKMSNKILEEDNKEGDNWGRDHWEHTVEDTSRKVGKDGGIIFKLTGDTGKWGGGDGWNFRIERTILESRLVKDLDKAILKI